MASSASPEAAASRDPATSSRDQVAANRGSATVNRGPRKRRSEPEPLSRERRPGLPKAPAPPLGDDDAGRRAGRGRKRVRTRNSSPQGFSSLDVGRSTPVHPLTSLLCSFQNVRVTVAQLDALSLEELYALADKTGIDLPPGLERPFVVEEILEALEEDSQDRKEYQGEAAHIDEKKYSGLRIGDIEVDIGAGDSLVKRYNETMIRAIARDPFWAFAYWDVSDSELEALRGEESSAGLFLRVAELGSAPEGCDAHKDYFDIPVADNDSQWYINLPPPG